MTKHKIDTNLARKLIAEQFSQWENLEIKAVEPGGWDNKTFRLGDDMLIRMPTSEDYAAQVEKEQRWLPKLASSLPLSIPTPIAIGRPSEDYSMPWSVYQWIEGTTVSESKPTNLCDIAEKLSQFLNALYAADTTDGPAAGAHNFYRGGDLKTYDANTKKMITTLKDEIDSDVAIDIWQRGLSSHWSKVPVWVHGDISAGNLLMRDNILIAVIDFGLLAVGDPSCDLMIAWTLFEGESRDIFQRSLALDDDTWDRARAWTLWKMLGYICSGKTNMNDEAKRSKIILNNLLQASLA